MARYQAPALADRDQSDTVTNVTIAAETGLAISKAKARSDLAKAMTAAGYSFASLAAAVSRELGRTVKESTLKMATKRPAGDSRPISRDVAEVIQRLTGIEASRKNWPNLQD